MHKNTKSSPRFDNSVAAAAASHVTHVKLLFRHSMMEQCSGAVPVCSDTLHFSTSLAPLPGLLQDSAPVMRLYKLLWWWEDQSRANSFRVFTFFRICIGCDLRRCRCPEQICENAKTCPLSRHQAFKQFHSADLTSQHFRKYQEAKRGYEWYKLLSAKPSNLRHSKPRCKMSCKMHLPPGKHIVPLIPGRFGNGWK